MAFLTVNGSINLNVIDEGFAEDEAEIIGRQRRMFSGALRSMERAAKRVWRGTAYFATEAEYQAFRAACPVGIAVSLTGDIMAAETVTCFLTLGPVAYVNAGGGTTWYRTAAFTFRES